jgi:hypothetical protein
MRGGSSGNIPHAPYLARDESVDLPYCLQNNSVTRFYVCALATARASWGLCGRGVASPGGCAW